MGCGRLGYDPRDPSIDAHVTGGSGDAVGDGVVTVCPQDTTEISAGASTCIELDERLDVTWTMANGMCAAAGRRLCLGAEWRTACQGIPGLNDMVDDWEWVAENDGVNADKWGSGTCDDFAIHEIFVDSYAYRCCAAKQ
jgi:hypothetical protein